MYTATVISKEYDGGALKLTVQFENGEKSFTETCIPQNQEGFDYWIKSRLEVFNSGTDIDSKIEVGDLVIPEVKVPDPIDPIAVERQAFFSDLNHFYRVKLNMLDNGFLAEDDADVVALKDKIKRAYKAEYFNFI